MHNNPGAPHAPTGTLEVLSLGALLAKDIPDRELMLGPWLHQRHLTMIYAPTGVGKSMFTMSAALAVAGGGSYLGWRAPKARPVLLVDGEMDVLDLKERAAMLLPTIEGVDPVAASRNLLILAQQAQEPGVKFPDLADAAGRADILNMTAKHRAELVILDNFSTLTTVEDENKASSFDPVMNLMRDLKHAGPACALVHHSRKGSGGAGAYRGSSKMGVVFNSIIALHHPGGVPCTTGAAFDLRWEKYRGRRDETMWPLRVKLEGEHNGPAKWTWEPIEDAALLGLLAALKSMKYPTQKSLAMALGTTSVEITRQKKRAVAQGFIKETEWNQLLLRARAQPEQSGHF